MLQQFLGQIAVRVDESNTVAGGDVLHDEVAEQGRFANAGLADDVNVLAAVGSRNAKEPALAPHFTFPDDDSVVVHGSKASRHSSHAESPRVECDLRYGQRP